MSTSKKIIIIVSIGLNLVFLFLSAILIAKFVYWEGRPSWFHGSHHMGGRNFNDSYMGGGDNMRNENYFENRENYFLKNEEKNLNER